MNSMSLEKLFSLKQRMQNWMESNLAVIEYYKLSDLASAAVIKTLAELQVTITLILTSKFQQER